jgi:hypothetical protein
MSCPALELCMSPTFRNPTSIRVRADRWSSSIGTRGSAEVPGILQRHDQGCVEPSEGLEDTKLPLWAPNGVLLAPTSPKLV